MEDKRGDDSLVIYGTQHPVACPECKSPLYLRKSIYGPVYLCANWPDCSVTASIHKDGRLKSAPAGKYQRAVRRTLHSMLDPFWQNRHNSRQIRKDVYVYMAELLHIEEFHIGFLTMEQLEKAIKLVKHELPKKFKRF